MEKAKASEPRNRTKKLGKLHVELFAQSNRPTKLNLEIGETGKGKNISATIELHYPELKSENPLLVYFYEMNVPHQSQTALRGCLDATFNTGKAIDLFKKNYCKVTDGQLFYVPFIGERKALTKTEKSVKDFSKLDKAEQRVWFLSQGIPENLVDSVIAEMDKS